MATKNESDVQVKDTKTGKRNKKKDKLKDKREDSEHDKSENANTKSEQRKVKKRKSKIEEVTKDQEDSSPNDQQDENRSSTTPVSPKKAKPDPNADGNEAETEGTTENTKVSKKPSKRQLKKEKAEKRESDKREASKLEATQKALNYLSKWKHAKAEWKFEKLRQIWLMDNLLDDKVISDDMFSIVLEYFEGSKGMARQQLVKKGMDIIKKAEEDEDNRENIIESIEYKRARELLQTLPTET